MLWRKTSNGTQTPEGERFVERILSISQTCRLNQQPLHAYLIDVHDARLTGQPIPSPIPATRAPPDPRPYPGDLNAYPRPPCVAH